MNQEIVASRPPLAALDHGNDFTQMCLRPGYEWSSVLPLHSPMNQLTEEAAQVEPILVSVVEEVQPKPLTAPA